MGYGRHATHHEQYATPALFSTGQQPDIVNFLLWMKREGYSESSITNIRKILVKLATRLGNLLDRDSVKDFVAQMGAKGGPKKNNLLAYAFYSKWKGYKFDLPRISNTEPEIPFIPLENELDALISGASRKLSTLLQFLKETGCRVGEVQRLQWTDIDAEANIVNIRAEKGSRNRQCKTVAETCLDGSATSHEEQTSVQ